MPKDSPRKRKKKGKRKKATKRMVVVAAPAGGLGDTKMPQLVKIAATVLNNKQKHQVLAKVRGDQLQELATEYRDTKTEVEKLESTLNTEIEDREDVIEHLEGKCLLFQETIETMTRDERKLEEQRDKMQIKLSMQIAQQQRELHETKEKIRELEQASSSNIILVEENHELRLRSEKLQQELTLHKKIVEDFQVRQSQQEQAQLYITEAEQTDSVIPMLFKLMSTLRKSANMQIEICMALKEVVKIDQNVQRIMDAHGIQSIIFTLKSHIDDDHVVNSVLRLLWKLASYDLARELLGQPQVVEIILQSIVTKSYNIRLFMNVTAVLKILVPQKQVEHFMQHKALQPKSKPRASTNLTTCASSTSLNQNQEAESLSKSVSLVSLSSHAPPGSQTQAMEDICILLATTEAYSSEPNIELMGFQAIEKIVAAIPDCNYLFSSTIVLQYFISVLQNNTSQVQTKRLFLVLCCNAWKHMQSNIVIDQLRKTLFRLKMDQHLLQSVQVHFENDQEICVLVAEIYDLLSIFISKHLQQWLPKIVNTYDESETFTLPMTTELIQHSTKIVKLPLLINRNDKTQDLLLDIHNIPPR